MLCAKPYINKGIAHGCGQCLPCRVKKQTEWAHRIELESMTHEQNCFVTLTYAEHNLPVTSGNPPLATLVPRDITLWLKRLRKAVSPIKIRYFVVGEYGGKGHRPHYHAVLFGLGGCHWGRTRRLGNGKTPNQECCPNCALIAQTWSTEKGPIGLIEVGELNQKTGNYAARYVIKKMTNGDNPKLQGRHPEFCTMSKMKGGLGYGMANDIASTVQQQANYRSDTDAPHVLLHGRKQKPLGRYLRGKVRIAMGKDEKTPQKTLDVMENKMRAVRLFAFHHSRSFSETVSEVFEPNRINLETRLNLYKSKDVL